LGDRLPPFFPETLALALLTLGVFKFFKGQDWLERFLTVCFVGLALVASALAFSDKRDVSITWLDYNQELIDHARAQNRPVRIDFTADWCINCKVLEKTVYRKERVTKKLEEKRILKVKVDLTDYGENKKKLLLQYGGAAIPYTVILDGRGEVVFKKTGIFTGSKLIDVLGSMGEG
jgi:thiol:disulfide interchange protein